MRCEICDRNDDCDCETAEEEASVLEMSSDWINDPV